MNIKRSTEAQVYDSIISDLKQAAERFAKAKDVEEVGRANEMSALSLLGKVYLTLGKYAEAEQTLKTVINSGNTPFCPIMPTCSTRPKKTSKKPSLRFSILKNSAELANRFIFLFAPHTSGGAVTNRPNINIVGAGWNQPTDDLINAFEAGDTRKAVSIGFWNGLDWTMSYALSPIAPNTKPPFLPLTIAVATIFPSYVTRMSC